MKKLVKESLNEAYKNIPLPYAGGGCALGGNSKFPCDDSWVDKKGRMIEIACTREVHSEAYKIPEHLDDVLEFIRCFGYHCRIIRNDFEND